MLEKVHFMLPFDEKAFNVDPRARRVVPGKMTRELAECMLAGDLALVDYAGESLEEMMEELDRSFSGVHGSYLEEASLFIPYGGEVASAIIMTLEEGMPLVTFIFTHQKHGRKGFSKALMSTAFYTLKERGYKGAHLYCDPRSFAIQLYRSMGFEQIF